MVLYEKKIFFFFHLRHLKEYLYLFLFKKCYLKIVSEVLHARSKKTRYTLEVISYLAV